MKILFPLVFVLSCFLVLGVQASTIDIEWKKSFAFDSGQTLCDYSVLDKDNNIIVSGRFFPEYSLKEFTFIMKIAPTGNLINKFLDTNFSRINYMQINNDSIVIFSTYKTKSKYYKISKSIYDLDLNLISRSDSKDSLSSSISTIYLREDGNWELLSSFNETSRYAYILDEYLNLIEKKSILISTNSEIFGTFINFCNKYIDGDFYSLVSRKDTAYIINKYDSCISKINIEEFEYPYYFMKTNDQNNLIFARKIDASLEIIKLNPNFSLNDRYSLTSPNYISPIYACELGNYYFICGVRKQTNHPVYQDKGYLIVSKDFNTIVCDTVYGTELWDQFTDLIKLDNLSALLVGSEGDSLTLEKFVLSPTSVTENSNDLMKVNYSCNNSELTISTIDKAIGGISAFTLDGKSINISELSRSSFSSTYKLSCFGPCFLRIEIDNKIIHKKIMCNK